MTGSIAISFLVTALLMSSDTLFMLIRRALTPHEMLDGKEWARLLDRIQAVSGAFSIVANLFLIFLIITKSPKQIGAYKYLMIYISFFEIFYSVIDAVIYPFHHSFGSAFVVIVSAKDRSMSPTLLNILNSLYWGCFGTSLAIFGVHFIYRFLVASGNELVKSFNSWKICVWLLIPLAFGVTWCIVGYFLCGPTPSTTNYIKDNVNETFGLEENEFVYLGPYFYENTAFNTTIIHWAPFIGISINSTSVGISFFTVIFFGIKCYRSINALVANASRNLASSRSSVLQTQLFYALVVQTIIPVFLMHIPVSIVFAFTFLDINIGMLSGVLSMTIALYPAIDPLPNLFIIKNYRLAIFGYLSFLTKWARRKPPVRETTTEMTVTRTTQSQSRHQDNPY